MNAPRILINVFHPNLAQSRGNRLIIDELRQLSANTGPSEQQSCRGANVPSWPQAADLRSSPSPTRRATCASYWRDTYRATHRPTPTKYSSQVSEMAYG
jgi:hypothetical protein